MFDTANRKSSMQSEIVTRETMSLYNRVDFLVISEDTHTIKSYTKTADVTITTCNNTVNTPKTMTVELSATEPPVPTVWHVRENGNGKVE